MRLGAYGCILDQDSQAYAAYGQEQISERHRHRYEFNNDFKEKLISKGLWMTGVSPDGRPGEIVELKDHPWFSGLPVSPGIQITADKAPSTVQ